MFLSNQRSPVHRGEDTRHYLTGNVKDYVPVFTMFKPQNGGYSVRSSMGNTQINDRLTNFNASDKPLYKYFSSNAATNNVNTFKKYEAYCDSFEESIDAYIEDLDIEYNVLIPGPNSAGIRSYIFLNDRVLYDNSWERVRLREREYLTNFWFIAGLGEDLALDPLVCLVTKRECIPYLRLCALLNEQPDPSVLELWVKDCVISDTKGYKNFRTNMNKNLVSLTEAEGIKTVKKESLYELFNVLKTPTFKKISERKEWIQEQTLEVIEHLKVAERMKRSFNIELVL
jgi:hypothetical protein